MRGTLNRRICIKSKQQLTLDTGKAFKVGYIDGSGYEGQWSLDRTSVSNAAINDFQFGLVEPDGKTWHSSRDGPLGWFGIGTEEQENASAGKVYPNWPSRLKQDGLIATRAYSVFLDDLEARSGHILFGGVDSSKYKGPLYTVPITDYPRLTANSELHIGDDTMGSFKAWLDTGASSMFMPAELQASVAKRLGATQKVGRIYLCPQQPTEDLVFNFSGAEIRVPPSEYAVPAHEYDTSLPDDGSWAIWIYDTPEQENKDFPGVVSLGVSFLRSAYVVFDLDNKEISLAQASYDSTATNVVKIGTDGVPNAQPAPGLSS